MMTQQQNRSPSCHWIMTNSLNITFWLKWMLIIYQGGGKIAGREKLMCFRGRRNHWLVLTDSNWILILNFKMTFRIQKNRQDCPFFICIYMNIEFDRLEIYAGFSYSLRFSFRQKIVTTLYAWLRTIMAC